MKFPKALAALLFAAATAQAAPDAQHILAASDEVRNPNKPYSVVISLTEFRNKQQTDANALTAYVKSDPSTRQFRSLIRYIEPARDAGKLLLKSGTDLWFFDPASQSSIRLSPQQRLLGQAANGDVVSVNLAVDYKAELLAEEDLPDGEKVMRHAYKLGLAAASPDVTYHHIEIWIDAPTSRPIRARFYSESNRLLKTAYYRKYQPQLGAERPTEVIIIDGLDPGWVTIMRYSDYAARDVRDAWFQRDYLPRFKPE